MKLAWSNLAKAEMLALRQYSIENWGRDIAARYVGGVRDAAKGVAADPLLARGLTGLLRILRVRSHYLIVHVDERDQRVTIAGCCTLPWISNAIFLDRPERIGGCTWDG